MSVLIVNETTDDRGAGKDMDGCNYRRSFVVLLDPAVGAGVHDPVDARVAVGNPEFGHQPAYVGAPHPSDDTIHCLRVEPRQRRESRLTFDVVADYGLHTYGGEDAVTNPLLRAPDISIGSAQYMKVLERDYSDPPRAVVNSVGQPFDPGLEIPVSRPPLIIVQNEAWTGVTGVANMFAKVREFDNTINAKVYEGALEGTLRVRIHASRMFQTGTYNGNPYYWRVSYELEHERNGWVSEGDVLDQGMMHWVPISEEIEELRRIKGDDGEPVPDPWPLDGSGHALTKAEIDADPPGFYYQHFTVYLETNFGDLGLQIRAGHGVGYI